MIHLWVRAESRETEARVAVMPKGVAALRAAGYAVTVEDSHNRAVATADYAKAGATIAPAGSWDAAPPNAFVLGLKELPETDTAMRHRHIMFGHAYKGQMAGQRLLARFKAGGGTLYDLEYLEDETGRRVAAFGYWAGYAGAAVSLLAFAAQQRGGICPPVGIWGSPDALRDEVTAALAGIRARVLVIGALGRVGRGACDLCEAVGQSVTRWDQAETAQGGPFDEVLAQDVFLNCILAQPGAPVFVPADSGAKPRALRVIGDIACDPGSDFSPIKVYDQVTGWDHPVTRVWTTPPLDVMAIDNLPSLLPQAASEDFAAQLLPHLMTLSRDDEGVWGRAKAYFDRHLRAACP